MKNVCKNCGKEYEFEPKRGTYKFQYCCAKCRDEWIKKDELAQYRVCEECGKKYWWEENQPNYKEGKKYVDSKRFCSFECGIKNKYDKVRLNWENKTEEEKKELGKKTSQWFKNAKKEDLEKRSKKREQTCLERYGVKNAMDTDFVKDKVKQKWMEKTPEEIAERTKKIQNTNLQRYGVKVASQSKEVQEKIKKTNLEKYGVDCVLKSSAIQEKIANTNFEKYGYIRASKNEEVKQKMKDTNDNKSEELKRKIEEKRKNTCLEKYGVEYAIGSKEIQDKIKKTGLEKYGAYTFLISKDGREKVKETNLKKYGVEWSIGSNEVQEKIKNTNLEKYGYEYPFQDQSSRSEMEKKRKETNLKRYGTKNIIQVQEFKEKARQTCLEKYGVEYNCLTEECIKASGLVVSKTNLRFQERLLKEGVNGELEFRIKKYSYDIKVGDILIEIDPTYTHQSTRELPFFGKRIPPKSPTYHQDKSLFALKNGYFCLHIWDWDDEDKIVEILKPKKPLYARSLEIKEPSYEEIGLFLEKYHLQGSCYGQEIRLGLYKDDELIQVMTFGKPRYNKTYEYELLRLCTKAGYSVVGGAERLFNHFLNTYNPNSIISYCDNSKFKGDVYKKLGMELKSYGKPSKHWFNPFTFRHITDNLLRQRGYSQLHNDKIHKKGESNELLMLEAGYLEIYDCGQSTFIWKKR